MLRLIASNVINPSVFTARAQQRLLSIFAEWLEFKKHSIEYALIGSNYSMWQEVEKCRRLYFSPNKWDRCLYESRLNLLPYRKPSELYYGYDNKDRRYKIANAELQQQFIMYYTTCRR